MSRGNVFYGLIVSPRSMKDLCIYTGFLTVENGKISQKGSKDEYKKLLQAGAFSGYELMELTKGQFLVPGFVDCHTHAPQFPNIGLGLDKPLLEWLAKYTFPLEKQYGDVEFAIQVYDKVVKRLLTCGTTTACYFGSIHLDGTMALVKSVIENGQRALVGKVSMNIKNDAGYYNNTNVELDEVESFIANVIECKNDLVLPIITPRFALSCDRELMTGLARLADKYRCRIQSHISENCKEIELVLLSNPGCKSYAEVYDESNILRKGCIMAHAVHLTEAEMSLLATRGVSVAHCPTSNTRLLSGLCPARRLLDSGLALGLATDVSGGDSASLLEAMRRAMDVSTHLQLTGDQGDPLSWREVLCLATLGGATALNLEDKIGSFEVGKEFDALLVDVSKGPIDKYEYSVASTDIEFGESLVQRLVYLADDRNILRVYVKGYLVKNIS